MHRKLTCLSLRPSITISILLASLVAHSGRSSAATLSVVTLNVSPSTTTLGQTATITATVTPASATGKVTFFDGQTMLGIRAVSSGTATLATSLLPSGNRAVRAYYSGDINNPGSSSAVVQEQVTALPQGGFSPSSSYGAGNFAISITVGDFNGDGKPDFAVANEQANNVSVLIGNGDGSFRTAVNYATGTNPYSVVAADFDGDGKTDLAVANSNVSGTGVGNISILAGNGDGTFRAAVNLIPGPGASPYALTAADFNGDGKADLAVVSFSNQSIYILQGNGDGTFQTGVRYVVGANPQSIVAGDFNGDGKTDLAVANSSVSTTGNGSVSVLLGNGDGTFLAAASYAANANPSSIGVADFNGDGKQDLAVANQNSFDISILTGNGDGTFRASTNYPANGKVAGLVVADFNGDGKPDVAVANPQSNTASVLLGNGDGTLQAATTYATDISPFSMVAGDFNGDGRTDMAIANVSGWNVTVYLGKAPGTTTTLTSSLNPSSYGQNITLTASVAPSAATGNVTFYDGTSVLGTRALSGGQATLGTNLLSTGTRAFASLLRWGHPFHCRHFCQCSADCEFPSRQWISTER
jgi:hypothetical protein